MFASPFRPRVVTMALAAVLGFACASSRQEEPEAPTRAEPVSPSSPTAQHEAGTVRAAPDDALGGRLYDRFYDGESFRPDRADTPEPDGLGGPFGNGTLPGGKGTPLPNTGHDYRLKNLFGWDLRGPRGIYGPDFQNKDFLAGVDLLDEDLTPDALERLLRDGSERVPAYGKVLQGDFEALLAFVTAMREGRLPRAERIWTLSKGTPGSYRLVEGANPERGKELFAERCAGCHGRDGTKFLFDGGEYSLGSHARQKAYEDWLKILNGQPHSSMKRFVEGTGAAELGSQILDLLAALCDRSSFPVGSATKPDVPDGDPRCGSYLR
jgi:mono/diheme cytochrome c family protein